MIKKLKKIIPATALLSVIVLLFSGCGALTLVSSIFNRATPAPADNPPAESEPYVEGQSDYNYDNNNYNTVIVDNGQPVETTSSYVIAPATTLAPSPAAAPSAGTTKPAATAPATTVASQQQTTQQSAVPDTTQPAVPDTTSVEDMTEEDFSELTVQQIQAMLFDTEDPNVAGKILTLAGFAYDPEQSVYYSTLNPWQRFFGFNMIYDMAAPRVGMVYDTARIYFSYDNKDWMIQIWKGQYGITAGAEVGLYNKPKDRIIPQYACAKDEDLITMKFDFYNGGKYEFTRGPEKHWWLTGFKIFNVGISFMIDLDITLEFPTRDMALAFEKGLKQTAAQQLLDPMTYTRNGKTFNIKW